MWEPILGGGPRVNFLLFFPSASHQCQKTANLFLGGSEEAALDGTTYSSLGVFPSQCANWARNTSSRRGMMAPWCLRITWGRTLHALGMVIKNMIYKHDDKQYMPTSRPKWSVVNIQAESHHADANQVFEIDSGSVKLYSQLPRQPIEISHSCSSKIPKILQNFVPQLISICAPFLECFYL